MRLNEAESVFDSADLAVLQRAYDEACRAMGVEPNSIDPSTDEQIREALARAIIEVAATGIWDPRVLKFRAVQMVRNPEINGS